MKIFTREKPETRRRQETWGRSHCEFCERTDSLENWRDDTQRIHLVCDSVECEDQAREAGYTYE